MLINILFEPEPFSIQFKNAENNTEIRHPNFCTIFPLFFYSIIYVFSYCYMGMCIRILVNNIMFIYFLS